jgi:hypothetical protein
MAHSTKETTTLSSLKARYESGKIDKIRLAFHTDQDGRVLESEETLFSTVDPDDIPNTPQTVRARVDYEFTQNYAYIDADFVL